MKIGIAAAILSADYQPPSLIGRLGQNRFVLGGVAFALLAAGLAWQWSGLVTIGVAPLLLSAAPCVVMCALGLCMHRIAGGSCHASNAESPRTPADPERIASATHDQTINQGGMI